MQAVTTIHSTGVNWGQALATWIPIVLAVAASVTATVRFVARMREKQQARFENMISSAISEFGRIMSVRVDGIEAHLQSQDREVRDRFDRVDRQTGQDST